MGISSSNQVDNERARDHIRWLMGMPDRKSGTPRQALEWHILRACVGKMEISNVLDTDPEAFNTTLVIMENRLLFNNFCACIRKHPRQSEEHFAQLYSSVRKKISGEKLTIEEENIC